MLYLHIFTAQRLCYSESTSTLLSVSGDSTLCAYDLRNAANNARSDEQESGFAFATFVHVSIINCDDNDHTSLIFKFS